MAKRVPFALSAKVGVEIFLGQVGQQRGFPDGSVVDQYVDVAEVIERFPEQAADVCDLAYISLHSQSFSASSFDACDHFFGRLGALRVVDRDGRAILSYAFGYSASDSSSSAGDNCDFSSERLHSATSFLRVLREFTKLLLLTARFPALPNRALLNQDLNAKLNPTFD